MVNNAQDLPREAMSADDSPPPPPRRYAVLLFDGFQALDAFGPLDVLNLLSRDADLQLSLAVVAAEHRPIPTRAPGSGLTTEQRVMPTHSFSDAPGDIEVLLVPGGQGTRNTEATKREVDFIRTRFPSLRALLTVCTGAALAARAGVLKDVKATTNKLAFNWVTKQSGAEDVQWVRNARWVHDGKVWSSSGISAGMDMFYAFVATTYGENVAANLARTAEYTRNTDSTNDPFSENIDRGT